MPTFVPYSHSNNRWSVGCRLVEHATDDAEAEVQPSWEAEVAGAETPDHAHAAFAVLAYATDEVQPSGATEVDGLTAPPRATGHSADPAWVAVPVDFTAVSGQPVPGLVPALRAMMVPPPRPFL